MLSASINLRISEDTRIWTTPDFSNTIKAVRYFIRIKVYRTEVLFPNFIPLVFEVANKGTAIHA
jgi:hypothetical protein